MGNLTANNAPPSGGPPWIQPEIQQRIAWRDGDVVISVPAKSGTTWTMNIVFQLLTGGTADFRDVYEEVPWIEFVGSPDRPIEDVVAQIDAMPTDRRRAFKTHSAPPQLPFVASGSGKDIKYIVVFRNPEEALVSFWPFMAKHSDAWIDIWGMPEGALKFPDFPTFFRQFVEPGGMHRHAFFDFLNAWWPLRGEPNVLFLHFAEMKRDHEGTIRRIAKFIGAEPSDEQWPAILEYTSFAWMKAHGDKFEARTVGKVPILDSGAMVRKGAVGQARADGMTDEIAAELRKVGEDACPDPAALEWYYSGKIPA